MIKLVDSIRDLGAGATLTIYADSKDEFEAETITVVGFSGDIPAGSKIYTADGGNGIVKSDGSVAWQSGGGGGTLTFTVYTNEGTEDSYTFEPGMTFLDFIESDYNVDGRFTENPDVAEVEYYGHPLRINEDERVSSSYEIYDDLAYTVDFNE